MAVPVSASQSNIIYEYRTISQKKGQSFDNMLSQSGLSKDDQQLMKLLPVRYQALENRQHKVIVVPILYCKMTKQFIL